MRRNNSKKIMHRQAQGIIAIAIMASLKIMILKVVAMNIQER